MELRDFLKKDALHTAEEEIDVRLVLAEYAALKDENAEMKEPLAYLEKVVYGQKSEKIEIVM